MSDIQEIKVSGFDTPTQLDVPELIEEASPLTIVDRTADARQVANLLRYAKYRADNLQAVLNEDNASNNSNSSLLQAALDEFQSPKKSK